MNIPGDFWSQALGVNFHGKQVVLGQILIEIWENYHIFSILHSRRMYQGDLSRKKMVSGDIVKNLVDFLSYIEPFFLCNVCVTGT